MKEDRICIFNEEKKKKSKKELNTKNEIICETEINLKDNPKINLFEKENVQQNSNRAESMTNEKQTFSTTNTSKLVRPSVHLSKIFTLVEKRTMLKNVDKGIFHGHFSM